MKETNAERIEKLLRSVPMQQPTVEFSERLMERLMQGETVRKNETELRLEETLLVFSLLAISTAVIVFADLGFIGQYALRASTRLPEWLHLFSAAWNTGLKLLNHIPALAYLTAAATGLLWAADRFLFSRLRQQSALFLNL